MMEKLPKIDSKLAQGVSMMMDLDWEYQWQMIEEYALESVYRECGLESPQMYGVWPGGRRSGRTYRMLVRVMLTAMQYDLRDIDVVAPNSYLANELCRRFKGIVYGVYKLDGNFRQRAVINYTSINFRSVNDNVYGRDTLTFYDHTVHDMDFIEVSARRVGRTHRINEMMEVYKKTGAFITWR